MTFTLATFSTTLAKTTFVLKNAVTVVLIPFDPAFALTV
jgi:hypothetical protein